MIFISGMRGGSGAGVAAGRKAGWLAAALNYVLPAPAARPGRAQGAPAAQRSLGGSVLPAVRGPVSGPDGRPLPPDGSPPPARPRSTAPPTAAPARSRPGTWPALGPDGRPLPPAGAVPARPHVAAAARQQPRPPAAPVSRRSPGTSLPPGQAPAAPAGHSFVAHPVPAPPGEFLFDLRCSCGATAQAPVTLAGLRQAAGRGLPAAEAIASATQDALDAMHGGPPDRG